MILFQKTKNIKNTGPYTVYSLFLREYTSAKLSENVKDIIKESKNFDLNDLH